MTATATRPRRASAARTDATAPKTAAQPRKAHTAAPTVAEPAAPKSRVVGYMRVSTAEQADSGLGLAAQRTAIATAASSRGWEVVWVVDDGFSAKNLDRPGVRRALEMLAAGEASALVSSKLDRLSRSVVDFSQTLTVAKKQGWSLVLLDLGVDTSTPNGKLVAGLMSQIAEWERELIGSRTKDALAAAKARGQRLGRPRVTPDAVVARVVALSADLSPQKVAHQLTAEGVPTTRGAACWSASTVRRLLRGVELDTYAASVSCDGDGSRD
jgi:DNA invertase Pin-like site-specific DNA recombinase